MVGGIVYEPNTVDADGDWTDREEIFKAMESFAKNGFNLGEQHAGSADAVVVESFQAERDTYKGRDYIPAGAWYMTVKVLDDDLWAKIKKGKINSFSMAGNAKVANG